MSWVVVLAITGAALVTGLLFAFSTCVMRALADLPNESGMFAMQRINEAILNPLFLTVFIGTPLLCVVIAAHSLWDLDDAGGATAVGRSPRSAGGSARDHGGLQRAAERPAGRGGRGCGR